MSRWSAKEEEALAEVKRRLKDQLTNRPQFPEVVGDRRLIRFLRGKSLNIDESTKMISSFLNWRDAYKVDDIRQDIVYGGKDTPYKFPFGKIIIDLAPQIIISSLSIDKKGRPLAMEMFDFSPKDVLEAISIQDYLVFLTYSLEYRAIVMEQMSHEREQEYLKEYPNPADRKEGYGVVLLDYTIRDLKGVGLAHLSAKGRALVGAALELGLPNYQEYLGKCVMINTPWIFNTFWYFVKGFLDAETIAKINFVGSNYMPVLLEDMELQCIPERLGGQFTQYNEAYVFDTSVGGPLYCEDTAATVVAVEGVEVGECDSSISDLSDTCWRNVSTPTCSTKGNSSSDALTTEGLHSNSHKAAATTTTGIAAELSIANIDTSSSLSYSPLSSASTTPPTYTEDQGPAEHSLNNKSKQPPRGAAALAGQASHPSGPSRTAASMLFRRTPSSTTNSNTDTSSRQNRDKEGEKGKTPPRGSGSTTFNTTAEKEEETNIMNTTTTSTDATATTKLSSPIVTTTATTATGRNPTRRGSQLVPTPEAATAAAANIAASTYNTGLNTYNNNTTTTTSTTTTIPSTQKNPIYSLIHAIFTEFSECFYSLYHVLTHYPLKTLLTTTIIAWCLYMRIQGYLHLMVFPVLLLFSIVYFELLR